MDSVNFFNRTYFPEGNKKILERLAETSDYLLHFGNKKFLVLSGTVINNKKSVLVTPDPVKYSKKEIVFKIVALPFLGIPALLFKAGYRLSHHFVIQTPNTAQSPFKVLTPAPANSTTAPISQNPPIISDPQVNQLSPVTETQNQEPAPIPLSNSNLTIEPHQSDSPPPTDRVKESQERFKTLLSEVNGYAQPILAGFGEYVVFHNQDNQQKPVTKEIYEKVYDVFSDSLPHLTNKHPIEDGEQRYHFLRNKVKELDPSLELTFIPRTLYELTYLEQCIEEDLKQAYVCPRIEYLHQKNKIKNLESQKLIDKNEAESLYKKVASTLEFAPSKEDCWHLTYFCDSSKDAHHKQIKRIAHRLNNVIVEKLPHSNPLLYSEIQDMTSESLKLFKEISPGNPSDKHKLAEKISKENLSGSEIPGPTANFSLDKEKLIIKANLLFSLGISENEEHLIKNCVTIECSKLAQNHFLLYRGGMLKSDSLDCNGLPYSLSYGVSALAGSAYDAGATAFHFMRIRGRNAYVIPISYNEASKGGLLHIPRSSAICQLTSNGEFFHARTTAPADSAPDSPILGISGHSRMAYSKIPEDFKSTMSLSELKEQFEKTMNQSISLK